MIFKCISCGKVFKPLRGSKGIYCSRQCKKKNKNVTTICNICGKEFTHYRSIRRNYCSRQCAGKRLKGINHPTWWKGGKKDHICIKCGIKFFAFPYAKRVYCSNKCRFTHKIFDKHGYIKIYSPNHPFNTYGYVREHRLIVEKHIHRFLRAGEIVHHINGVKSDNRIENLYLFPDIASHISLGHNGQHSKNIKLHSNLL